MSRLFHMAVRVLRYKRPLEGVVAVCAVAIAVGLLFLCRPDNPLAVREVYEFGVNSLWADDYKPVPSRHRFPVPWAVGPSTKQLELIRNADVAFVAILAPSRPEDAQLHGYRVEKLFEIKDVSAARSVFVNPLGATSFDYDDHLGGCRYAVRFTCTNGDAPNATVDILFAEPYSVALVYSKQELTQTMCDRSVFSLFRRVTNDDWNPAWTSN